MTKSLLFLLFVLISIPFYVSAYPEGAGTCDVENITDGHPTTGLKSPAGYALSTAMPTKGNFEITVNGPGGDFKGLLVYVVNANNDRVGEFVNLPQTIRAKTEPGCGQGSATITHKSPANKNLPFKLNWNAPQGTSGNLTVKALVVKNFSNWARLNDVTFDPLTGTSNASAPQNDGNQQPAGDTESFFDKYLLFIIMIIITTILYIVGSVTEALLKRQQVKSRSFAKTVGGFSNAK